MLRWVRVSRGKEAERAARDKGMSKGKHTEAGDSMGGAGNFIPCWIAKCKSGRWEQPLERLIGAKSLKAWCAALRGLAFLPQGGASLGSLRAGS